MTNPDPNRLEDLRIRYIGVSLLALVLAAICICAWYLFSMNRTLVRVEQSLLAAQKMAARVPGIPPRGEREPSFKADAVDPSLLKDRVLGDPKAGVVLISYMDYDCPYCGVLYKSIRQLANETDPGVAFAFRHNPLDIHPNAKRAAIAAECVGKELGTSEFWKFSDLLFDTELRKSGLDSVTANFLKGESRSSGAVKGCIASRAVEEKIDLYLAEAEKVGAVGTPTSVIINRSSGKSKFLVGARTSEQLKKELKDL